MFERCLQGQLVMPIEQHGLYSAKCEAKVACCCYSIDWMHPAHSVKVFDSKFVRSLNLSRSDRPPAVGKHVRPNIVELV